MKTTVKLAALLLFAVIGIGVAVNAPAPSMATVLPLPHVTLNKTVADQFSPGSRCSASVTAPYRNGLQLRAQSRVSCYDGDGYKIVGIRTVGRLYARRSSAQAWHVYSSTRSTAYHRWQGEALLALADQCHAGSGRYQYQARFVTTVRWSRPALGYEGAFHIYRRPVSSGSPDCGGSE